ncbi:MAG TPA: phage tail sheath subtilisin-like domain-containing protein [Pseudomonadota bacterium]|nr:phage tail sheath subtilisin-like domain-containing protein [Pseudomonadota bacterium]
MPSSLTYPGVYIEEIPSGIRTVTGVATSVTAFVGRAQRGPVGEPVVLSSFRDYERNFGGLWLDSTMSFAVYDFFKNGGSQAVIVRAFKKPTTTATDGSTTSASGVATFTADTLGLSAKSPGTWAANLLVSVDYTDRTSDVSAEIAKNLGIATSDLFNVAITYFAASGAVTERFVNVNLKDNVRRVDRVLEQKSLFVRVTAGSDGNPTLPTAVPAASTANATTGEVGVRANTGTALDSLPLTSTEYDFSVLDKTDTVNLICVPPDTRGGDTANAVYSNALTYAVKRRAILIVDPPAAWSSKAAQDIKTSDLGLTGPAARNAVVYYPRIRKPNPLRSDLVEEFAPSGLCAGIISRTDTQRGIWKSPAGIDAALYGVDSVLPKLSDSDSGTLNPMGVNCIRSFPASGQVIWGARTLRGADALGDEYKYLSVRRLALYLEESIYRGTQWAVFEPNDEPLWAQIRLNIGTFMQNLFRQGAFQGSSPRDAYFVKCDKETTTAADIQAGIVNIVIGFAPLKPAEFVVIKFQQAAGQSS